MSRSSGDNLREHSAPSSLGRWWYRHGRFGASHALLTLLAATMLVPFLWMVFASIKPLKEVEDINPFPSAWKWHDITARPRTVAKETYNQAKDNYVGVFKQVAFARYYFNSLFVAAWVTLLQCLTSSMAAYAFSRLRWRGRDHVFRLYLATLMIPGVVTMIPNYTLMVKLGLLDSYAGLIVPAAFSAFGTFLLRQFMLTIPPSLDEAAAIDGASHWQIFWDVIMPLARPGLITLGILTFLGNYGSFFWPLILIKSEHLRTLPIGMLYFDTMYGRQTNLIMAASVMNIIPLIILFVVSQKFIVKGIQLGAVKG
jgi:ABC-type glycerol-3-phosphate transport system permease component